MKILVTGAYGNVGQSTLDELIAKGHEVTAFEADTPRNRTLCLRFKKSVRQLWGDIRNASAVEAAVAGQDCVIHLAAVIPPASIAAPLLAESVNIDGTRNVISAIEKQSPKPDLIYASSIAIYGDRLANPLIRATDEPNPNSDDEYARHKLRCEGIIRATDLNWLILRLTYIVSARRAVPDPLMFEMPLDTRLEICDTRDTGLAFANAAERTGVRKKVLNIAGGERCRISYREYLQQMLEIFGLGWNALPMFAFSRRGYHCGFMDTEESQRLLGYQRVTLDDYLLEVRSIWKSRKFLVRLLRPFIVQWMLLRSPHYCRATGIKLFKPVNART
jgi:nucleoside-diphosphate-sugar epimerase